MDPLLKTAQSVVTPAVRWWLADRRARAERTLPLNDLIDVRVTDNFRRRGLRREVEAMCDAVAERVLPLYEADLAGPDDAERVAAFAAVADAFEHGELTDEALFAADLAPAVIARRLRERLGDRHGLSDPGRRLYEALLAECCDAYVQLVRQLAPFQPRALTELLSRVSGLGEQLRQALSRLPVRTLDAPDGDDHDEEFRRRYLSAVIANLEELEMFGVDSSQYRPRTSVSVGYISLTVCADDAPLDRLRSGRLLPGPAGFGAGFAPDRDGEATLRVEAVVGAGRRLLLRGEAGSGKTTLLRWLAVTAARGGFTGDLAGWTGLVPFLVKLRSYAGGPLPKPAQFLDGVADILADRMPAGWVHRQLIADRAFLLVDGVDELTAQQRPKVREWLRQLLHEYPQIRMIVTSRPAAAVPSWLQAEGFRSAMLERMSAPDVRRFIGQWHEAVRHAGGYPCDEHELPRYEAALLGRLDANPHLAQLVASPILCAMLCALNLVRRTQLPADRLGVYRAALELLIERREVERGIPSYREIALATADKLHLLRHLAWRMAVNNRAEVPVEDARHWIGDKLRSLPSVSADAADVLRHLIERSGLLRQPAVGRIDFIHRSLQEYLAAVEAAEQGDLGLLVDRAHLDQWRETVIMAAGAANVPVRRRLIDELARRAEEESRHSRALKLLIAACMETMSAPEPAVLSTVEHCFDAVLPPRNVRESRSLASLGEPLLHRAPASLAELSAAQAVALVRAVALVNGPAALDRLARWADDPRHQVQRELMKAWRYFDPAEYTDRVLADAPLVDGSAVIEEEDQLPYARRLRHLTDLEVSLSDHSPVPDLNVPHLHKLSLRGGIADLSPLAVHKDLNFLSVTLVVEDEAVLEPLACLPTLETLLLLGRVSATAFRTSALSQLPRLNHLSLHLRWQDLSFIRTLTRLRSLVVDAPLDPAWLAGTSLEYLQVIEGGIEGGLSLLASTLPSLKFLRIEVNPEVDLGVLRRLPRLGHLQLQGSADLSGLTRLAALTKLSLVGDGPYDLAPLRGLSGLRMLECWHRPEPAAFAAIPEATFRVRFLGGTDLRPYRAVAPKVRFCTY